MSKLLRLRANILDTPLMITRSKLQEILGVIGPRMDIDIADLDLGLDIPTSTTLLAYSQSDRVSYGAPGVGVVPVHGTLVHRGSGVNALSGLSSYQYIRRNFDKAMNDPGVSKVVLDIDSPGGEAAGVFDLSDHIYNSRGRKPIIASVNESAFSAAYAIASAADKIYVSRTAGVGSVGVMALHMDKTQKDEKEGVKYTAVYAGKKKVDLNPHMPLSDEAKATIQARVDKTYDLFVKTVARNNAVDEDKIRNTEAGIFTGEDAVKAGLADGLKTYEDLMTDLTDGGKSDMTMRGENNTIEALQDEIEGLKAEVENLSSLRDNLQARISEMEAQAEENILETIKATSETAIEAERARIVGIIEACVVSKLEKSLPDVVALINDADLSVEDVKAKLMEELNILSEARTVTSTLSSTGGANPLLMDADRRAKEAEEGR